MSALRIDRKIEVRDVGRGEQSGFARVPEFIERLNGLSPSLNWKLEGRELVFDQTPDTSTSTTCSAATTSASRCCSSTS